VPFELVIVTPHREVYRDRVDGVVLPGSEGEFGVLESHERFLSPLRVGQAEIRKGSETLLAAIASGFARVEGQSVSVLVDACELAGEIDVARARAAEEQARQALGMLGLQADPEERARNEAELLWAQTLIATAERKGTLLVQKFRNRENQPRIGSAGRGF
jgi:F-type H+-transporting ATPase subunit epsilon